MIIGDWVKHTSGVVGQVTFIIPTVMSGCQWLDIIDDKSIKFRVKASECIVYKKYNEDITHPFRLGDRVMQMGTVVGYNADFSPTLFRVLLDKDGVPAAMSSGAGGVYMSTENMVLLTRRKPQ